MNSINLIWTDFKAVVVARSLSVQYFEFSDSYSLFLFDGALTSDCTLYKDGGADVLDFEANFKPSGNGIVKNNVVVSTSALPTGAATSALQTTGNSSVSSIDSKTPALGQALVAASTPVVLPASQITTLTPPTTVTANAGTGNYNNAGIGTVGSAVPLSAEQIGGSDGTNLRTLQLKNAAPNLTTYGLVSRVIPFEPATFTAIAETIRTANNKSMISVANTGTSVLRVEQIYIQNERTSNTTGVHADFRIHRFTTRSSGTSVSANPHDTNDSVPSGVSCHTGTTISGESTLYKTFLWTTENMNPDGTSDIATDEHATQIFPFWESKPNTKPIIIRQNEGVHVRCGTNTTTGIFNITIIFSVEPT